MLVLPVGLRFVVVVDSKLRAAVEAAEAQGATLRRPYGVLAGFVGLGLVCFLHLYGLHGTFLGTQAATDTLAFVHAEELGLTLVCQQRIGDHAEEIRHSVMAFVALYAGFDHRYYFVYLRLGGIHLLLHFDWIGEIEHRCPVVRHLDRETSIHSDAFALQFTACILADKALHEAIRSDREHVVVLCQTDVGFLDKLTYENRQLVPVGRGNESQQLVVCETDFSTGGLDGLRLCAECFGDTGCHMLTVARGGEIIYHVLIVLRCKGTKKIPLMQGFAGFLVVYCCFWRRMAWMKVSSLEYCFR